MSFVMTEKTPNPESLKFIPHGQEVLGEGKGTMNFPSARSAYNSPLALALFKVEGVKGAYEVQEILHNPERSQVLALKIEFY
jgi:hypothetical protein